MLVEFETVNQDLFPHYIAIQKLGHGSFGQVYVGKSIKTHTHIAIKAIKWADTERRSEVQKFFKESHLHSTFDHPNIIRFMQLIQGPTTAYLILEFAGGGDLRTYLRHRKSLQQNEPDFTPSSQPVIRDIEASLLIKSVLLAIKYLHDMDVVHRDIKAENILLLPSKDLTKLKIADFGLSTQFFAMREKTLQVKCGTLTYMSPEVIKGRKYTKKVDIYSIGV